MENKERQLKLQFPDLRYTFADFFCGAGGFSTGMIQAGMKCIAAVENEPYAIASYWSNLCLKGWSHLWVTPERSKDKKFIKKIGNGETINEVFDIPTDNWISDTKQISPCLNLFGYDINELEPEQFMEMCGVRPGDIRVFVGGPPCQGFSTANNFRSVGDERNKLPLRMIYFAKICRPDYVFIENVPGLLTLGRGKNPESPFVVWIREAFADAGYDMTYGVHNAANYGVPQNRRRVFFQAYRKGIKPFEFPKPTHGEAENLTPYVHVLEAIGDYPTIRNGMTYGGEPYAYNHRDGYVICPHCLKYNREIRKHCHECGGELSNPIRGGVFRFPGLGYMAGIEKKWTLMKSLNFIIKMKTLSILKIFKIIDKIWH
jgi:site-specific DNA-cytosine methylase